MTESPRNPVDELADLLVKYRTAGYDVADLVAAACTTATERLPVGQALTDERPGSWESAALDQLVDPETRWRGPALGSYDVECPGCYRQPGETCLHMTLYTDLKRVHRARASLAKLLSEPSTNAVSSW